MVAKGILTCVRLKVRPGILLKKMTPSLVMGWLTASSSMTFGLCTEINEKKLGIAPEFSRIGYALGSAVYNVCMAPVFVLIAYYMAEIYGVGGGIVWMLTLWIVSAVISFAVPPVSGGTLACIGVLLTQLNIPSEALAVAGILSIVLDYICTGFGLGMHHMELSL